MIPVHIHNPYVFDTSTGKYFRGYLDLDERDIPPELKSGDFTVLSEYRAGALMQKPDPQEVAANRIARIKDGVLTADPDEWTRNYQPK